MKPDKEDNSIHRYWAFSSLNLTKFLLLELFHSLFTGGETEAQRGKVTCLCCAAGKWEDWDENPDLLQSRCLSDGAESMTG